MKQPSSNIKITHLGDVDPCFGWHGARVSDTVVRHLVVGPRGGSQVEILRTHGDIAERTELLRERLPPGPCAGLPHLLKIFSVINKAEYGGGGYTRSRNLGEVPSEAGICSLYRLCPTLTPIERGGDKWRRTRKAWP